MRAGVVVALALASCSEDRAPPQVERPPSPQRRVIEPPSTTARLLPPYVITATEVGPYKLRQKMSTLLDRLPKGPRMERFEIPNVIHTSLMRAEDGTVLIGGEPAATTTFVAVISSGEVARTEHGVHVGARATELAKLGTLLDEPDRTFDPHLLVPTAMRNARFVSGGASDPRIVAVVILGETAPTVPQPTDACTRPKSTDTMFGLCIAGGERLVERDGEELSIYTPDGPKLSTITVPNLQFAAALRNPIDGRDELVAISRSDELRTRTWSIVAYRFDGLKRAVSIEPQALYTLTAAQTRWIGTELKDIDLYLELASKPEGIEVAGLLTTRGSNDRIRDVVAISPVMAPRRHLGKPAAGEIGDAGVPDVEPDAKSRTHEP